ncbi:hypothetical protein F0562_028415 [Nyssa sinensis]|uniref:Uncharacterized protein n=1 Tax=Nyssa sinensis TaxID=561372 RepID=A0A5J5B2A9_9ASTE|nr:hypothetical protein F0562_028415 [Nyssa sinensis]
MASCACAICSTFHQPLTEAAGAIIDVPKSPGEDRLSEVPRQSPGVGGYLFGSLDNRLGVWNGLRIGLLAYEIKYWP